jgi:hypothetical protein
VVRLIFIVDGVSGYFRGKRYGVNQSCSRTFIDGIFSSKMIHNLIVGPDSYKPGLYCVLLNDKLRYRATAYFFGCYQQLPRPITGRGVNGWL